MIKTLFKKIVHCSPIGTGAVFGWQNYSANAFQSFIVDYKNFGIGIAIHNFKILLLTQ